MSKMKQKAAQLASKDKPSSKIQQKDVKPASKPDQNQRERGKGFPSRGR